MELGVSREYLIEHYSAALSDRRASMFIGAGLSRAAELADWRNLLRKVARELKLQIDKEHDLVAVAQYHVNVKGRAYINRLIVDEFLKGVKITENHRLIATLPLAEVWTTNYDSLIEDAFRQAHRLPDVKKRVANLSLPIRKADVVVYKMHGDAEEADEAVITKDDYERYNDPDHRQSFSLTLQGHLISKSFLFLGFSFTDPNIEYILSRVRVLVGTRGGSEHFCIMKRPTRPAPFKGEEKDEYIRETVRLEHRVNDLRRFNINTHLIDSYGEITDILRELNRRQHLKNIFVSGSAAEYSPLGRERVDKLCHLIGSEIINRGFNLVTGFGLGIGSSIVTGAVEAVYRDEQAQLAERATLLPFPRGIADPAEKAKTYHRYRTDMISQSGFALFICGNRRNESDGKLALSPGVFDEFRLATEKGVYPIPIGATGHAASAIWREVTDNLRAFYGKVPVSNDLRVLNDARKTNEQYVDAIFSIIHKTIERGGH